MQALVMKGCLKNIVSVAIEKIVKIARFKEKIELSDASVSRIKYC